MATVSNEEAGDIKSKIRVHSCQSNEDMAPKTLVNLIISQSCWICRKYNVHSFFVLHLCILMLIYIFSDKRKNTFASSVAAISPSRTTCWFTSVHTRTRGHFLVIFVGRRSDVRTISETTGITPLLSPNPDQNCVKCLKYCLMKYSFSKENISLAIHNHWRFWTWKWSLYTILF